MKRFAFTVLFFLLFVSVIPVFADYGEIIQIASYQVTFTVENGTFDGDGDSTVRTVMLDVNEGGTATLGENDIPKLGGPISENYKEGEWVPYEPTTTTVIRGDTVFSYTYVEMELVTYTVIFHVENGTFKNGSTEFSLEKVGDAELGITLAAGDIPELGEPEEGYQAGSWDKDPIDTNNNKITDYDNPTEFTYTFTPKTPFSYEVTFKAVNGTFNGGKQQIMLTLNGYKEDGEVLKLGNDQIPEVGEPNEGYKPGSWDADVRAGTEIRGDTTFTYTYAQKGRISYTVVFEVVLGQWDDGTYEKKEVILEGFEDETLTLRAEDIPPVGSRPEANAQAGWWNGEVPSPDTVITGNKYYQYGYRSIVLQSVETLKTVPPELEDIYHDDLNALEQALLKDLKINGLSAQIDQTLFVDVQASVDGGITWKSSIGEDLLPEGGLRVDIPYPKGTGRDTHDFGVSHMFGETNEKLGINAGGIEYPPVRLLEDHFSVELKGLSPMAISWRAKSSMDLPVNFVLLHSDGTRGVPFDIKEGTLKPVLTIKKGGEAVAKSGALEVKITAGMPNEVSDTAAFSNKVEDLAPGKYEVSVSGLPKEMEKEVPDPANNPKYRLTAKAEINIKDSKTVITVYLIFSPPAPPEPVVYPLPEDEIGAYAILKDGTKEYLLFHTYDICMAWLGSDELCRGPERCFHKDGK